MVEETMPLSNEAEHHRESVDADESSTSEVREALKIMRGFVSTPYGSSSQRDEKLRQVWLGKRTTAVAPQKR